MQQKLPLSMPEGSPTSRSENFDNTASEVSEIVQMSATADGAECTLPDTPTQVEIDRQID